VAGGQVVNIWILDGGTLDLYQQSANLTSVALSPDFRWLASVSADNSVVVWDMETDEPLITLWHDSNANAVVFSPDGTLLATAGSDGTVRLWGVLP
jgi:WD40 repeat protein